MEVRNSTFAAFIDVFTPNTYVMVIMSDNTIRKYIYNNFLIGDTYVQLAHPWSWFLIQELLYFLHFKLPSVYNRPDRKTFLQPLCNC